MNRCFITATLRLYVSPHPAQIHRPMAPLHRRATSGQQTGHGQWGGGSCSLQVDSALLLGCSLLSTRPGPRQLHTGVTSSLWKSSLFKHCVLWGQLTPETIQRRFVFCRFSQNLVKMWAAFRWKPDSCKKLLIYFCPFHLFFCFQVILAQMEVYEKSLKQAQRCLLRKAEWGEAILPQAEVWPGV